MPRPTNGGLWARRRLPRNPRSRTVTAVLAALASASAVVFALATPKAEAASTPPATAAWDVETGTALTTLAMIAQPPVLALPGKMISPGALAKAHSSFDTTDNCIKCHDKGAHAVTNARCVQSGCHASDIGEHQAKKLHFHGSKTVLSRTCGECHYDHLDLTFDMINDKNPKAVINGQTVPASPWGVAMQKADGSKKNWDHDLTGYKLIGGHKIDCDKCHKPDDKRPNSQTRTFLGLSQQCLACHENYHNFPKGDKFEDCLLCHTFITWKKFNLKGFDHDKTQFPLRGAHDRVQCDKCHAKKQPFAPLPHDTCETCHLKDSPHGKTFTTRKCEYCHTENSWKQIKVTTREHNKFAKYDANGAHARLACATCHKGLKTTPSQRGAAEGVCTACHNNIHGDDWMKGTKVCTKCHTEERWKPLKVDDTDHKTWSNWSLLGSSEPASKSRHMQLQCIACHTDLKTIPEKHECTYCHLDFHAKVDRQSKGPRCEQCHNTSGWVETGKSFDHDKTKFPLTGAHKTVTCESCHPEMKAGQSAHKVDRECKSCHKSPHLGKLPDTCDKCHNTDDWRPADGFDHNRDSKFKLSGKHQQVGCFVCHTDMGFKGLPMQCEGCHSDYHKGAWGPVGCNQCHSEARWRIERGVLNFASLHNWGDVVLGGQHSKLACEVCHSPNPRFLMSGFTGECNTCHVDVHLGARGQECWRCHSQWQWLPAQFNHNTTGFPLYGTHRLVACAECHKGNVYTGLPDECIFCHTEDAVKGHTATLNNGPSGNNGDVHCQDCHVPTTWFQHNP